MEQQMKSVRDSAVNMLFSQHNTLIQYNGAGSDEIHNEVNKAFESLSNDKRDKTCKILRNATEFDSIKKKQRGVTLETVTDS